MMHTQSANDHYLGNAVLSASPAKLRFMLLERALIVVRMISEERTQNPERIVTERTITLRDILGELLSGVRKSDNEVAQTVADLYIFLLQELTAAEQNQGTDRIEGIGRVLEIEKETWAQVCEMQAKAARPDVPKPHAPILSQSTGSNFVPGSLNLNA